MRKWMKLKWQRLLLVLLLLALVVSAVPVPARAINLTEEQAASMGADVYQAWFILNFPNYDLYVNQYKSPYRMEVEDKENSVWWKTGLALWRTSTFDVKSEAEYAQAEIAVYQALLFNILYDETSGSLGSKLSVSISNGVNAANKEWEKVEVSAWGDLLKNLPDVKKSDKIADLAKDELYQIAKVIDEIPELKKATNAVKKVGDISATAAYFLDVADYIKSLAQIEVLLRTSYEAADILESMANHLSGAVFMEQSIRSFIPALRGELSKEQIVMLLNRDWMLAESVKLLTDCVYDAVTVAMGKLGLAIKAGQGVGKFTATQLFNTSNVVASYYKLRAMYAFEDAMKEELKRREESFQRNPNAETAKHFVEANRLWMETLQEGIECTKEYLHENTQEGWTQLLFNSQQAEYDSLIARLDENKSLMKRTLDCYEDTAFNFYLAAMDRVAANAKKPSAVQVVQARPVAQNVTEEEYQQAQQTLLRNTEILSNHVYDWDTVMTRDLDTKGSVTIQSGRFNLNGYKMTIAGNLIVNGGSLNLNGGTIEVGGDLIVRGNGIDLQKGSIKVGGSAKFAGNVDLFMGSMTVQGSVTHETDTLIFNKGRLLVGGDYVMEQLVTDRFGEVSDLGTAGQISMAYPEDHFTIRGSFVHKRDADQYYMYPFDLSAGTMEVGRNFCSTTKFRAAGTHKTVFNGAGRQEIQFQWTDARFHEIEFGTGSEPVLTGIFHAEKLLCDVMMKSEGGAICGLGLNQHKLHILGDVTVDGESILDLDRGSLTVDGNVLHKNGQIKLTKGTLLINGNYTGRTMGEDEFGAPVEQPGNGALIMTYPEDRMRVTGDYYSRHGDTYAGQSLTAGTMELLGNFDVSGFYASGTHTVVFCGDGLQRVSFRGSRGAFNRLKVEQTAGLLASDTLTINRLLSDCTIQTEGMGLHGADLNGFHMNITGPVTFDGSFGYAGGAINQIVLHGGSLAIDGDTVIGNGVDLSQGQLEITGNVRHESGEIRFNRGTMHVTGDYAAQKLTVNDRGEQTYGSGSGKLVMYDPLDLMQVDGDFLAGQSDIPQGNHSLGGGVMQLSGNVQANDDFITYGSHKVILNGTKPQTVTFRGTTGGIQQLEITNPSDVTFDGTIKVKELQSDAAICSKDAVIRELGLNGHALRISGDVVVGGAMDLYQGVLTIDGNVRHESGMISFRRGTLHITGDYAAREITVNEYGEQSYTSVSTDFKMREPQDLFWLEGNYWGELTNGLYGGELSSGTMKIAGDFSANSNFSAVGDHLTILNGSAVQHVTFRDGGRFNILNLKQPTSQYVFDPDPCWNKLYEIPQISDVAVTGVTLSARTKSLTVKEQYQLTASVLPENATDQTLTWSSSAPEVASVDRSGLVQAQKEGTAVIKVTAANGLYRTCTVTVHEIFSGIFTVGTCKAMPGDTLDLPITVWDNPGFAAARMTLTYDPQVLTPLSILPGKDFGQGDCEFAINRPGSCTVLWSSPVDNHSSGEFLLLRCKVAEDTPLNSSSALELTVPFGDVCKADHTDVGFSTEAGSLQIQPVLPGDIHEDGKVGPHDIVDLQRYLTELMHFCDRQKQAADLNADQKVDMADIVLLAQKLVQEPDIHLMGGSADGQTFRIQVDGGTFDGQGCVLVPVSFPGSSAAALRLQIGYDSQLMELTEITPTAPVLAGKLCSNLSDPERSRTLVTWYSDRDQQFEGTAFTMKFRLLDPSFDGQASVEVSAAENDVCSAALTALPVQNGIGTVSANREVRLERVRIVGDQLQFVVTGAEEMDTAALYIACYDRAHRMTHVQCELLSIETDRGQSITLERTPAHSICVFLLERGTNVPISPKTVIEMRP